MAGERIPRNPLRDFLLAARARLESEDIGVKPALERRGGGLHRADLADVLIVSNRWHNGFENGTACPAGNSQIDRLASIPQLTVAERVCLCLLVTGQEPALATGGSQSQAAVGHAVMTWLLDLMGPELPALLCDLAWNRLAWNTALTELIAERAADHNVIV